MNLTLFLLLALTASWTGLVQCEDNEETEHGNALEDLPIFQEGEEENSEDSKEDPYLDHEDHEKVPMPMFEDDIPSVMELEMEDLENWMTKGTICGPDAIFMCPHIQCCTDYMLRPLET
ncbi:transmembrane protein 154 isoform X2 [Labeo rohita]|uniref:Transmembrane protein 154 isoform X2 n=1 Tax=Labeo rohita TaxID=84645 RepID=A0A498LJ01_LABRO|nr:transmembrane protein 154 isoform X2 [Labeo rohita]RXN12306.1 transmembrane protein 154 isoform X2 [Labeo rohita]